MAYGTIKVDTITFTNAGVDKSVAISGLVQNPTFSGNITVTGTVSGNTIQGQTVSGVTVTGTTANFASGVFTTQISGATVTGNVGSFSTITGGTVTLTSGVFGAGSAANPSISFTGDANTGIYSPGADQVAISTNGTQKLLINSAGRLTNTGTGLGINFSGYSDLTFTDPVSGNSIYLNTYTPGNAAFLGSNNGATFNYGWGSASTTHIFYSGSTAERLRITSAGLVGVGTSSPSTSLDVRGIISLGSSSVANAVIQKSAVPGGSFNLTITSGGGLTSESATTPTDALAGSVIKLLGGDPTTDTFGGGIQYYANGSTSPNGAGVGNQHVFYTRSAANTYTERLRIDASGRVGVGTTSPANNLHVNASNATFDLQDSAATNSIGRFINASGILYIQSQDNTSHGQIVFRTSDGSATERLRIDSSGRVGIGTSSPGATLHVASSGNPEVLIGGAQTPILSFVGGTSSEPVIGYGVGSLRIGTVTGAGAAGFVERVRVDTQGRVGIGTTDIGDNLTISAANYRGLTLQTATSTDRPTIYFRNTGSASACHIQSLGQNLIFGRNPASDYGSHTETARIDASGRLLVGTSTAFTNIYHASTVGIQAPLQVRTAANDYSTGATYLNYSASGFSPVVTLGLSKNNTAGSNTVVANNDELGYLQFVGNDGTNFRTAAWIAAQVDGTPGSADMPGRLVFSTTADGASSPTERMRISQSGLVSIPGVYSFTTAAAANVYVESAGQLSRATSSSKYKINVETIEDVYADALLSCRPVWYRSTCANDNPDWGWWGFIAEEVAAIDPRLVHWKRSEVTYDKNGSAVSTPCNPEPEGVMYDRFVPHLLNLIKRQQQAIETLEAKVAALESA